MTVRVFAQKSGYSAEDHRLALSLTMAATGPGILDRRAGIVPSVGAADLTGVSPMVGRVAPCVAWVDGTSGALQGGYPVVVDADVDLTFDNGEAAVPRVDRVVCQVRDDPYDVSTFQDGRVVIVKGQASGAANPVPASSILLWEVNVPAGASVGSGGINFAAARVDKRPWTASLGGVIPVRDVADRSTLTAYAGLTVFRLDRQGRQVYDGAIWRWRDTITCSSAADRDTTIGAPWPGQTIYRSDTGNMEVHTGSAWRVVAIETTPWTDIPLAGGFSHNGGSGGRAQYRRVGDTVQLAGRIGGTIAAGGGTPIVGTLPAGFRPATFVGAAVDVSSTASERVIRLDIGADGTLATYAIVAHTWVGLDGTSFRAA